MATLTQIEQRELELAQEQEEAQRLSNQAIPQRRYGSGVTAKTQQDFIARQQRARQVLEQIKEQRQNISSYKSSSSYVLQYARERGIKPKVSQRRYWVRDKETGEPMQGFASIITYVTPVGTYVDDSEWREARGEAVQSSTATYFDMRDRPQLDTVDVEGIGGISTAYPEQVAQKYAERGYVARTNTAIYSPVQPNAPDTIDLPEGSYSVARERQGAFVINKAARDYETEQLNYTKARLSNKPTKLYGSSLAGDNAVFRKEALGYDLTIGGVKTLSRAFEFALPKSAYERGTKRELSFANKRPLIYKGSRIAAEFTADSLGFAAVGGPFMSNRVATTNFLEPEFRVKPLSPKQAPRSIGFDVVEVGQNKFMFGENIKVPKRFQTVNTPLKDYFGYKPYRKLYSPEIILQQKTIEPVTINLEGDIVGAAPVRVQQVKPRF